MPRHVGPSKFKLCHCKLFQYPPDWEDHDLWTHRNSSSGIGPTPPTCTDCGGWPEWRSRDCSVCKNEFYYFFVHPQQRGFPLEVCWLCVQTVVGSGAFAHLEILRPHPDTLPRIRSKDELLAAIKNL